MVFCGTLSCAVLTVVVLLAFAIAILILFECELTYRLGIDRQQL